MRRKLFPPTQIISKAILQFPAWGSKLNMVQEYSKCLMGLNVGVAEIYPLPLVVSFKLSSFSPVNCVNSCLS